jgi:protein involved in polysaccharide export with SLBB domain
MRRDPRLTCPTRTRPAASMPASWLLPLLLLTLALLAPGARAQSGDPFNISPRGVTEMPAGSSSTAPSAPSAAPVVIAPAGGTPLRSSAELLPSPPPGALVPGGATPPQTAVAGAMPPDPALALKPVMFGSQMFTGRFASEAFSGFNPDYQIAVGDRVTVRMWGAYQFEAVQTVDAQGNIFIPNVGPVPVLGVRNLDLNRQIETQVKRVFRSNVSVYATLAAAQPVKVYVTGFVRAPGLYGGLSSDSVLYYLDRAGGIDPDRGSYLEVDVLRGGRPRAKINLYSFLLKGQIETLQLLDGDTIVVGSRKHILQIAGEVLNPYVFEFNRPDVSMAELLAVARPRPGATHLSIVRKVGSEQRSEYYPIGDAGQVRLTDGDEVTVMTDKYPGTILIRIEGAHLGERMTVLPYGARLKDVTDRLRPAPQASLAALQLYRQSVALRQKELMERSFRSLETYALTARSATSEEAALRSREAQAILQFIERARQVQPRGQVILADSTTAGETLLENGDVIRVPETSNLVQVSGEVLFPNALVYDARANIETYVQRAGGFTQGADKAKVVVVRQDGSVAETGTAPLRPGDEILVLPKIETKSIEITRGITQILYQIAIAAKVVLGL